MGKILNRWEWPSSPQCTISQQVSAPRYDLHLLKDNEDFYRDSIVLQYMYMFRTTVVIKMKTGKSNLMGWLDS
jgi:hypothetical protein